MAIHKLMAELPSSPYRGPSTLTGRLLNRQTTITLLPCRDEVGEPKNHRFKIRKRAEMGCVSAAQASFQTITAETSGKLALSATPVMLDAVRHTESSCKRLKGSLHPDALVCLHSIFNETERGRQLLSESKLPTFQRTPHKKTENYTAEIMQAVRSGKLQDLQSYLRQGISLESTNEYGETLLHLACRRSQTECVRFLIEEANLPVDVHDDFGRSPLHDACWTTYPNTEIMQLLLERASPITLIKPDIRGHTPFHYARKEHQEEWECFLKQNKDLLLAKLNVNGN